MNKTTKIFLIFLSAAFVIVTLLIMFGGYSYQLKGGTANHYIDKNAPQTQSGGNVDLSAYTSAMHDKISSKWAPPHTDEDAKVVLEFTIQKNGHVINAKIDQSSGNKEIDNSAMKALKKASPLPPLPLNLPQSSITVKFDFLVKGAK